MVRRPSKAISSKGVPWSAEEDQILKNYIKFHGEGSWTRVAEKTGLERSGKSCRLRWRNYLRPDIKRGNISDEEEDLIIRLHKLIGNRWALIAGRLPGRTDNEIKNYWNTILKKKKKKEVVQPTPSEKDHFIQKSDISSTGINTQDIDQLTINNEELIIKSLVRCDSNIIGGLNFTPTTTEDDPHNIGNDEDLSSWDFLGDFSGLSDMINNFDFSKDFLVD